MAPLDGNNFYASCERVFRPRLQGVPLVVLSNNDGCAIARSEEAKALGVRMGAPWFQIRHLEQAAGLVARVTPMAARLPIRFEVGAVATGKRGPRLALCISTQDARVCRNPGLLVGVP